MIATEWFVVAVVVTASTSSTLGVFLGAWLASRRVEDEELVLLVDEPGPRLEECEPVERPDACEPTRRGRR